MKSIILSITFLFINFQRNEVLYYKNAIPIILNSYILNKENSFDKSYYISSEIVAFSHYSVFFQNELKDSIVYNLNNKTVIRNEKGMVKLNSYKKGKFKLFFSEIKKDIFFVEVFESIKRRRIKYENKPIFGSSTIFMFKVENEITSLVSVKSFSHN